MRKVRSVASLFLALLVMIGMQFALGSVIRAEAGTFTNVQFNGGVLTWDEIPDCGLYTIRLFRHDTGEKLDGLSTTGNSYGIYGKLMEKGLNNITVDVELYARDRKGVNEYSWNGSYDINITTLNPVTNVVFDNEGLWWDHDTSNVEGLDVRYKVEVECEGISGLSVEVTKKYVPIKRFTLIGTHDYTIKITAMANACIPSTHTVNFKSKKVEGVPSFTGVKVEDDMIYWDQFGSDGKYMAFFNVTDSNGNKVPVCAESYTGGIYVPYILSRYGYGDIKDQTIRFYIAPSDWHGPIASFVSVDFQYKKKAPKTYPLSVYGLQLNSSMDLTNILGYFMYFPGSNRIFFNRAFDMPNADLKSFWIDGMDDSRPMFSSTEDLTITGSARIITQNEVIVCDKDLTFENFSIKMTSGNKGAINADNIFFNGGSIEVTSNAGNAVTAIGDAKFVKGGYTVYSFYSKSGNASDAGLHAGNVILDGCMINNGCYFDKFKKAVVDSSGAVAKRFYITEAKGSSATPTPSPTVTPKPLPTNTTKPVPTGTGKPVPTSKAKPSVTKAPGVTTKPGVTVTPGVTSKPGAPVTPRVTSVPSSVPDEQVLSFVKRIYIYVLDREPEAEGAAFWSNELWAFRRTGAEVAQGFIFSDEFINRKTSDKEFVTILYKTFFDREPEAEGLNFWLECLRTGTMDRVAVANGFIFSQEWADTCASYGIRSGGDIKPNNIIEPTDLTYAFVERMYTTAMGRDYDKQGRQYWAGELANFNITGEQVGAYFFLCDEMKGYDLSDSEYIDRLYRTFMNREADAGGASYWLGALATGADRAEVVYGFTRSSEFTDKCIEARILPY